MTCAGVYAKAGCWHNPDKVPTEPGFYSSDAWANLLGQKFDCVVLVRDNPAYDVEFIKQHARIFIDARQHGFDPASPQAQTAVQRSDPIHVVYTGVVPLVYKAQRSLLDSLIQSTFWSFVTITPLMMFLARNVIAGIVVMLPNALPVVVIFGSMGLLGIDVDVGSMMTASIAPGGGGRRYDPLPDVVPRRLRTAGRPQPGDPRRVSPLRLAHHASRGDQRLGAVRVRPQHVHAHAAVWLSDADHSVRRPGGRVDHAARAVGRTAGPILQPPPVAQGEGEAGTPATEPSSADTKPADAEAPADGGFAQPHITGDARPARQGALRRRDRGHDTRGR